MPPSPQLAAALYVHKELSPRRSPPPRSTGSRTRLPSPVAEATRSSGPQPKIHEEGKGLRANMSLSGASQAWLLAWVQIASAGAPTPPGRNIEFAGGERAMMSRCTKLQAGRGPSRETIGNESWGESRRAGCVGMKFSSKWRTGAANEFRARSRRERLPRRYFPLLAQPRRGCG